MEIWVRQEYPNNINKRCAPRPKEDKHSRNGEIWLVDLLIAFAPAEAEHA